MPDFIPADLDAFWTRTLAKARSAPLDAHIEPVLVNVPGYPQPVPERVPYSHHRLTFTSLGGVKIRANLYHPGDDHATPTPAQAASAQTPRDRHDRRDRGDRGNRGNRGGTWVSGRFRGRWPVVVTCPGYGGWEMLAQPGDAMRGCIVLQLSPRGMGESAELWQVPKGAYNAWINVGKHDPEGFYYQGAYIDYVRAIDYLVSRPDVDPDRIAITGASGGGTLALGVAAIDERVSAVVASEPFLCDFRHTPAQAGSDDVKDEAFLRTFDYFDPATIAHRITAPTLLCAGGRDATCPAVTIQKVFDRLSGVKALAWYPHLPHGIDTGFTGMSWEWVTRYCFT